MTDHIERFGASTLQHGPHNDRVYLMHLDSGDLPGIVDHIESLAATAGYGKIFAKVPLPLERAFTDAGFEAEALIPPSTATDGGGLVFVSRFLREERSVALDQPQITGCLETARAKAGGPRPAGLPAGTTLAPCGVDEADEIASIYATVFESYPFPIHDPAHVREGMLGDTVYYGVRQGKTWIAAAAAEKDPALGLVEMTDFATLPAHRGQGLAQALLERMTRDVCGTGIHLAYTIARATAVGMNVTFARCGYRFAGTLTNNTQIDGGFESMNVWYHYLDAAPLQA